MKIKDKVALVLGAIKGIGKSIGLALAEEGAKVAFNYFDWEESLAELQQDVVKTGRDHLLIKTDLLESEKIPELVKKVVDHFGRLDILINNIERGGWPVVHGPYVQGQWDLELPPPCGQKHGRLNPPSPILKNRGTAWS